MFMNPLLLFTSRFQAPPYLALVDRLPLASSELNNVNCLIVLCYQIEHFHNHIVLNLNLNGTSPSALLQIFGISLTSVWGQLVILP